MTRFDEVARLHELEKKADCPPWKYQKGKSGWTNDTVEDSKKGIMWWGNIADDDAIHLAVDLRNAAPWLLGAAACFQPGDARIFKGILRYLTEDFENGEHSNAMVMFLMEEDDMREDMVKTLLRMLKAAKIIGGLE